VAGTPADSEVELDGYRGLMSAFPTGVAVVTLRPPTARSPWPKARWSTVSVVGDHAVVLGDVVHVEQTADVPLLYGLRRFSQWR